MSKRAERAASAAYPFVKRKFVHPYGVTEFDGNYDKREVFREGYEQAEKDTFERAAKWIRAHWREYIWGPDADGCIGFGLWENDFRKAMEEE